MAEPNSSQQPELSSGDFIDCNISDEDLDHMLQMGNPRSIQIPPFIVPSQQPQATDDQPIFLHQPHEQPSPRDAWGQNFHDSAFSLHSSISTNPLEEEHGRLSQYSPEWMSPQYYQNTPSPGPTVPNFSVTTSGVVRSTLSRSSRMAEAAPYDIHRRVSAPSTPGGTPDAPPLRPHSASPSMMPPPALVPNRGRDPRTATPDPTDHSVKSQNIPTSPRPHLAARGKGGRGTVPRRASKPSSRKAVGVHFSEQPHSLPSPAHQSHSMLTPPLTMPSAGTSTTYGSTASHSPVRSSPLVSAPVRLPHPPSYSAPISPQGSPAYVPTLYAHSPDAASLLMSRGSRSPVTVTSTTLASSSSGSAVTGHTTSSHDSSTAWTPTTSIHSSHTSGTILSAVNKSPQSSPQQNAPKSILRQPSSTTPQSRATPYANARTSRRTVSEGSAPSRKRTFKHPHPNNVLNPNVLLTSPRTPPHMQHDPLASLLSPDMAHARRIPGDIRYEVADHTLTAVLEVPGLDVDDIALLLQDIQFNHSRVLYVSALRFSPFDWDHDDLRMSQQNETSLNSEHTREENTEEGKGEAVDPQPSTGTEREYKDASTTPSSDQPGFAGDNKQNTSPGPSQPPKRYIPSIRELRYGHSFRVIHVSPTTQLEDVSATLRNGLLHIKVDMGVPLEPSMPWKITIKTHSSEHSA